ncbi:hypothetical protein ACOCJ7_07150 [Knoellia sp. CPCC 206453]|uniref:hypothetical protein n=1 Tax=Knoellia pratensis TaxID=3404796 RepID=UPI003623EF05
MSPANPDPMVTSGAIGPHDDRQWKTGRRCSARAKSTGKQCQRAPIRGGSVCLVHGGTAPQVQASAARRLEVEEVEAEVRNLIAFESFEGVTDPLTVLSELAARALATEDALARRVNDLASSDSMRYRAAGAGTEQLRAEVALWERWHTIAARHAETLAKFNFEERRVRLSERQGDLVAEVLKAIFARLILTPEQQSLLPVVVPEELRRLASVPGEVVR